MTKMRSGPGCGGTAHRCKAMLVAGSIVGVTVGLTGLRAEDWPQWRGVDRLGVWTEDRIVDTFPADGLTVKWRVPISGGYAGPAV
ncbi:MAG: hypothetical protein VB674_03920, partial [Vicinamibacterales bacterium]